MRVIVTSLPTELEAISAQISRCMNPKALVETAFLCVIALMILLSSHERENRLYQKEKIGIYPIFSLISELIWRDVYSGLSMAVSTHCNDFNK